MIPLTIGGLYIDEHCTVDDPVCVYNISDEQVEPLLLDRMKGNYMIRYLEACPMVVIDDRPVEVIMSATFSMQCVNVLLKTGRRGYVSLGWFYHARRLA
jgi:hypothetical protein